MTQVRYRSKSPLLAPTLGFAFTKFSRNDYVVAFDYCGTRFEVREGKRHALFEPMTHKGNLMRHYECDAPG
jgi:hypothetical protein